MLMVEMDRGDDIIKVLTITMFVMARVLWVELSFTLRGSRRHGPDDATGTTTTSIITITMTITAISRQSLS